MEEPTCSQVADLEDAIADNVLERILLSWRQQKDRIAELESKVARLEAQLATPLEIAKAREVARVRRSAELWKDAAERANFALAALNEKPELPALTDVMP